MSYIRKLWNIEKTKRPVYAYFASEACSGGYYISIMNKIYANQEIAGQVRSVLLYRATVQKLYDKLGIREIDITSGKNKAIERQSGSDTGARDILRAG